MRPSTSLTRYVSPEVWKVAIIRNEELMLGLSIDPPCRLASSITGDHWPPVTLRIDPVGSAISRLLIEIAFMTDTNLLTSSKVLTKTLSVDLGALQYRLCLNGNV